MIQPGNKNNMTVMKNPPLLEKKKEEEEEEEEEEEVEDDSTEGGVIKNEDCSNEASSKTKNVQKASTPPSKRQLTVMETLQINKMKRDKEAGDKAEGS